MMPSDWFYLVLFSIVLGLVVFFAELVQRFFKWPPEATRKLVHIVVGVVVATTPFVLYSMWPMVILGALFTFVDFFHFAFFVHIH